MKVSLVALSLRLGLAWFLLSLTVLSLFLVGATQSFLDTTLKHLFLELRFLYWTGLLGSWFLLVPVCARRRRLLASLGLSMGFTVVYLVVLFWGAWIYPNVGTWPW